MRYYDELTRAMDMLAADPHTVFLGQSVGYPGTGITNTLKNVPKDRLIELPVMEDAQVGMSTGMALAGLIPVSIFPRWNFLLLGANQLVNHLDRLPLYSGGGYVPRVIIRVAVPSVSPLDPQAQHDADFTDAFQMMCKTVQFFRMHDAGSIVPAYEYALHHEGATVMVEYVDHYET